MEDERMCAHGKLYEKPCEACEVVWHREMLDHAQASVAYHRRKLAQLRWAGYSKSGAPESGEDGR